MEPPPSSRSLLRKQLQFGPTPTYGLPQLTWLIETGAPAPLQPAGATAMFAPLRKKPKTSLNGESTYSLYSSEAKTYWNTTCCAEVQVKSNSSTTESNVV